MPSIKDPHSVQIGSYAATDVLSIEWGEDRTPIKGRADDDLYDTIAEFGAATVRGAARFRDPLQAEAFANKGGTLSCSFKGMGGGADRTLTIANCVTGGARHVAGRDAIAGALVPFVARSADGAASPVSLQ
jgi:hypothetical protein